MKIDPLWKLPEVAAEFGVDTTTVRRWADRGWIKAVKLPSGHRRIRQSEVDRIKGETK